MFNKKIIKLFSILTIAASVFQGKSCLANNISLQENRVPRRSVHLKYSRARLDQTHDGIIDDYERKAYILGKILRSRALKASERSALREHPNSACLFVHPTTRLSNGNATIHIWIPKNPNKPWSKGIARPIKVIYE